MARPGIIAGITVLLGATLLTQEWSTYTNRVDRFEVNFPGQPKVEEIKVGSTIGVRCHQLRDGSSGCLLGLITLEGAAEKMFD
jgi:hypothetical protein